MNKMPHTILVVDDEPPILHALRRTLLQHGYRVLTAETAADALELLAEEDVDVLISDINMPMMSGVELASRVRQRFPDVVRILLSGGTDLHCAIQAINEGEVHRYLTKPWDQHELQHTVKQALERLEELRRSAGAARAAQRRQAALAELESEHPGITRVTREGGLYLIDDDHIERFARGIETSSLGVLLPGTPISNVIVGQS